MPDVSRVRGEMERIFRQVLAAPSVPIGAHELPIPFEFSLGVPLAEVPTARAALLLLRWMDEALDPQELSWLMLSGFLWRTQADLLPVAALDATIRGVGVLPPEYPLSAYLRQKGWRDHEAVESMRNRLHAARQGVVGRQRGDAYLCTVGRARGAYLDGGRLARAPSDAARGLSSAEKMVATAGQHRGARL